ncbi:unnamed protein product [Closterium sp. NIES-54]
MAYLHVLAFDHEGRSIQFDTWLDDLQLYLQSDSRDSVSLFDHTSGAAPAPPTTADSATCSQWLTRDAAARLAICNHPPLAECAHFGQQRTAQALYDDGVARYSSPAIAALGRLLLPYLFPELSAFATVEDLVSHLRTSNARYRAAAPAEFLEMNQPPMFITLYFIVTRLPDSLRSVRDHFLSLDPTVLTIDLLEQHLLAAETTVVADVGAALLVRSAAAVRARVTGVVAVAAGVVVGAAVEVVEAVEVVAAVGVVAGVGALVAAVEAAVGVAIVAAVRVVAVRLKLSVEVLEEARGSRSSIEARPRRLSSFTCGKPHIQHRCFSCLDVAWRAEFGDEVKRTCWAEQLRSGVAIFDLDYDVILAAMYTLSVSAKGDCYLCVPPDPCIEAAALGASESVLPGTAPAEALHTFTLDSGASRCFIRDSTTLTPLSAPVPVRLADPSGGTVLAHSSIVLPCPADAMVTTTTTGGQRVSICTCTRTGRHLATFTRRPGSSLYTLSSEPPQVAASAKVSMSGQVAPPCSCRLLSHQTLLWHHRLGHPSLPRLRGMHSRLLRFRQDQPVLHLLSDKGGEFSSNLLREFCRGEGILQSFTLPDSPQQNGISERRIGLVMEVARTSMIHAAAPHFLWPFARGKVGNSLVFGVWGSRAFVRDTSADKLSARAIPCIFLGFSPDAPGWQFYHPTSCRVFPSQDVTFDESVPFYRLFPYHSARPPPPPLFLAPGPPPVDPLPPQGPSPSGVSQVNPLPGTAPVEVAVGSGDARGAVSEGAASRGAEPGGADCEGAGSGGAEPGGAEPAGAEPAGVEPRVAEPESKESGDAEPRGNASSGCPAGASPRLSPQPELLSLKQLCEWFAQRTRLKSGTARDGDSAAGDTRAGGAGVTTGAGGLRGTAAAGIGGARTKGTGAARTGGVRGARAGDPTEPEAAGAGVARAVGAAAGGTGAGGAGAGGAGAVDPRARGAGGFVWL